MGKEINSKLTNNEIEIKLNNKYTLTGNSSPVSHQYILNRNMKDSEGLPFLKSIRYCNTLDRIFKIFCNTEMKGKSAKILNEISNDANKVYSKLFETFKKQKQQNKSFKIKLNDKYTLTKNQSIPSCQYILNKNVVNSEGLSSLKGIKYCNTLGEMFKVFCELEIKKKPAKTLEELSNNARKVYDELFEMLDGIDLLKQPSER